MTFQACILKEKGVTFAIACVKESVIQSRTETEKAMKLFTPYFPGVPIVLMANSSSGRPLYLGRNDIVKFLSRISPEQIPWKNYTIQDKDKDKETDQS